MKTELSMEFLLATAMLFLAASTTEAAPAKNSETSLTRSKRFFIESGECPFKVLCIHPSQCDQEAGELCMIWYCGTHCTVPEGDPADVPVLQDSDYQCLNWHNPECRPILRERRKQEREERQRERQERRRERQEARRN
ncbi:uncharacterized protein [Watersipora subatra]|uniref:uncharacterized protein n=1 Tax=Watersipora subatra TaxID=2589382 RepID=UPI00355BE80A